MQKLSWVLLGLFFVASLLCSCGEIVPVYSRIQKVPEYTLHFADQPVEFKISTDAPEPVMATRLEINLQIDQSTFKRESLPLMLILEGPDLSLEEFPVTIPVREGDTWLGETNENQVDVNVTFEAIPYLELDSPAKYSLKVFGNDDKEQQIFGVVKIGLRLYLHEGEETTGSE
ncbi:MAG: hypothetical protein R3B47_21850 [Bacteroidia bacterium]